MGAAAHSAGQSQFTPPPLVEEFSALLNLYANIKNLLDGFFEAVKVVVNQSFPSKAFLAEEADHGKKLGDLFQVYDCGVVQVNDGHRVFVMG